MDNEGPAHHHQQHCQNSPRPIVRICLLFRPQAAQTPASHCRKSCRPRRQRTSHSPLIEIPRRPSIAAPGKDQPVSSPLARPGFHDKSRTESAKAVPLNLVGIDGQDRDIRGGRLQPCPANRGAYHSLSLPTLVSNSLLMRGTWRVPDQVLHAVVVLARTPMKPSHQDDKRMNGTTKAAKWRSK